MQFRMTSFADNFEDVLIQRAFPEDHQGSYIDVGAYDPVEHSVTEHFYRKGWRGINIEPNPGPFAAIEAARTRDINLNLGVSDREGSLTVFEAPNACWSCDRDLLLGYFGARSQDLKERSIPVRTLAAVCDDHVPPGVTIDFLKVDVEGHEFAVIQGADWSRWRPRLVIIEANGRESWESILLQADYRFAFFDGVNCLYVRGEDAALIHRLNYPANASDQFLIYGYMKRIAELESALEHGSTPGSLSLQLARRINSVAHRYPRAAHFARKFARKLLA